MSGLSSSETSAEVRLLGALCRPRDCSSPSTPSWEQLVAQIGDWPRVVELLKHHRVVPLAARNADFMGQARLPVDIRANLQTWSGANAREAFRYLAALQQLLVLLANENIAAIVLKGVPLSLMAYGDVSARDVGDIDLLIEDRDALRADTVLRQSGLIRKEPVAMLTPKRASFYLRNFKDFTYEGPSGGFEVDLHWRLIRDSQTAAAILSGPIQGRSEGLSMGPLNLRVLSRNHTLLFLAVHGAMEGWARWKTLADVAALWTKSTPADRVQTWKLALKSSTTGFLAAALVLAGDWFGMDCGAEAVIHLDGSTVRDRRLFNNIVIYARHRMLQDAYAPSPAGSSTFAMKIHEARLHPSFQSRVELVKRILFRPRIWEAIDLPDSLFVLYPMLSPVEWVSFRSRKRSNRSIGH